MNKEKRILAIDPGMRKMGVAVLEYDRLVYHGVEIFRKLPSHRGELSQVCAAVTRLLRDFQPGVLVIEKNIIGKNRCAAPLNTLTREIAAWGRRRRIRVVSLAPNTVKKTVAGCGWAEKTAVAKAVAARYPKLKACLPPSRKWKLEHHYNMFDAVALGMAWLSTRAVRCRSQPIRAP